MQYLYLKDMHNGRKCYHTGDRVPDIINPFISLSWLPSFWLISRISVYFIFLRKRQHTPNNLMNIILYILFVTWNFYTPAILT